MQPSVRPIEYRRARWVLLLWVGLVLASAWSPWVHGSSLERLCTASGEVHWVSSPMAEDAAQANLSHGLDCPMCLPLGLASAVLPDTHSLAPRLQLAQLPQAAVERVWPRWLPPVRAPPEHV